MIEIKGVSKTYDSKSYANKNISLNIKDGEIFGLLGPNGAGKSTLLKIMTGIIKASEGDIILNGHSITEDTLEAKRNFAYVSDNPDNLLKLKGIEFLKFMADVFDVDPTQRVTRINELSKTFGMEKELDNQIESYSHGMRQKMMVMGALLNNPNIWILDEPMTGLDPQSTYNLKQKMREHANSGKTVVFSTHVLDVAEKIVDRVGVINKGELVFVGTVNEMKEHFSSNKSLEEMFLELTSDTKNQFEGKE